MSASFTADGFRRGFRATLPMAPAILLYAVAFGVVAAQASISLFWALAMSVTIYSGSAQLAAASLIGAGEAGFWTLALAILVINARYLLFGASLQPWLSKAGPWPAIAGLLMVVDASWILSMRAAETGERDRAFLAGSGMALFLPWIIGTAAGVIFGSVLPDAHALGADLMLPTFAGAIMAVMIRAPSALVPVAVGSIAAVLGARLIGPAWGIVAAGLAGGIVAAVTAGPGPKNDGVK